MSRSLSLYLSVLLLSLSLSTSVLLLPSRFFFFVCSRPFCFEGGIPGNGREKEQGTKRNAPQKWRVGEVRQKEKDSFVRRAIHLMHFYAAASRSKQPSHSLGSLRDARDPSGGVRASDGVARGKVEGNLQLD